MIVHADSRCFLIINITYLDVRNKWRAATLHETQWVFFFYQAEIQDILIINRHGLISQWNGWCYPLCQICTVQEIEFQRGWKYSRFRFVHNVYQLISYMFPYWPRMKLASFQCLHFQLSYFQSENTVFSFNYCKLNMLNMSSCFTIKSMIQVKEK